MENGCSRGGRFPELSHRELKEKAVAFYAENKVQDALETLLNEMFLSEPKDVFGYMSEYFCGLALKPVISQLCVTEGLDCNGGKSLELDLYCTVNGMDKHVSSVSLSQDLYNTDPSKPPLKKPSTKSSKVNLDQSEVNSVTSDCSEEVCAVGTITKYMVPAVKGISPASLTGVDQAIADKCCEDVVLHESALLAVSCATAVAGSTLCNTPLFLHLAKACRPPSTNSVPCTPNKRANSIVAPHSKRRSSNAHKFTMPIPVVSAISGGLSGTGKLKFREFCLSPLPGAPFPEQIEMILNVHEQLGKCLAGKFGPSGVGCLGSAGYCPAIDKPEQALDFIQEAAKNAGFALNQSVGVLIDVGAHRLYDEEKGKYELITGQWKSTDDVINMYAELCRVYPGLLGYIDPLHHKDIEGWKKLQEKLGNKCFLIADSTLKAGLAIHEPKPQSVQSSRPDSAEASPAEPNLAYLSCGTVRMEATLSQTIAKTALIKGHSYYVMLLVPPSLTMNTLPADLGVALMCRFIRMGAPTGLTSSGLMARLLKIREELVSRKLHDPAGAHVFTSTPEYVDTAHN